MFRRVKPPVIPGIVYKRRSIYIDIVISGLFALGYFVLTVQEVIEGLENRNWSGDFIQHIVIYSIFLIMPILARKKILATERSVQIDHDWVKVEYFSGQVRNAPLSDYYILIDEADTKNLTPKKPHFQVGLYHKDNVLIDDRKDSAIPKGRLSYIKLCPVIRRQDDLVAYITALQNGMAKPTKLIALGEPVFKAIEKIPVLNEMRLLPPSQQA